MRLIDADKLLDDYSVFGMANITREDVRDELYDLIDNQPTAYDIDKVVEELKEWSANVTILELHNNELGEYEEECKRDVICTLNAIDIVTQGKEQNE